MERDLYETSNNKVICRSNQPRVLCAVCGAPAIGRNFDAMTCLSCKAFFRRNAYNENLIYTCRLSSSCEISLATRRHCSACRLKKCFEQGMKKELIRSIIAITHATSAAMIANMAQQQPTTINFVTENSRYSLTIDDWNLLTNIRNAYDQYCIQKFIESHAVIPLIPPAQPYKARVKLQRLMELKYKYIHVIETFIERILQFDKFHCNDEYHYRYIKDSFSCLLSINTTELMKSNVLEHYPWKHDQLGMISVLSEGILRRVAKCIDTFRTLVPNDPVIIKLLLIILALSSRITPLKEKDEYTIRDFEPLPKTFLYSQNYYTTILWKYVIYRLGYRDAVNFSVRFIQNFLHRQTIESEMVEIVPKRDGYS